MAATACMSGPPCIIGNTALSRAAACSALHTSIPPRGPRRTLCVVNVTTSAYGTGLGIALPGDEADEVGGVDHEDRADLVGDLAERGEVDQARDRRAAADDHLRAVLAGEAAHLVVVDVLGVLADAVVHGVEPLAGERDLRAVGQVAAVREAHREDGVARLQEGPVHGDVGARAAVRLEVGVVGAEQGLGPLDAEGLRLVDDLAPAVVAASGVALGVLVRQRRAERGEDRGRGEVLAGDELQAVVEAVALGEQDPGDLGVGGLERAEVGAEGRGRGHGT